MLSVLVLVPATCSIAAHRCTLHRKTIHKKVVEGLRPILAHPSWPIFGIDWAEPASGGKYSVEAGGFMGKRLARRELFQEITVDREALHNF